MKTEEGNTEIMNLAVRAYELFKDDEVKAKGLADIFDLLEHYYIPRFEAIKKSDLENTKMELTLEIEKVRSDISNMQVEINKIHSDSEKHSVEIEKLRSETEKFRSETEKFRSETEKFRSETEKLRSETEMIKNEGRIERAAIKSDLEKFRYENMLELAKIRNDNELLREEFKKDIALTHKEIEKSKIDVMKYMNRHTLVVISSVSIIVALLKGIDYFLK